ncbi:predicted protein [Nematostella vectensis]|uniref:Cell cycle checkpoint control protein RAD9A n=1 Tax=Nematostella vectensis TaxID=45351 RepID=A7SKA2_NEMVE|nr:predicted protein [Nematostella vectensis]|eukprot:XP_001627922.1 predicted protein [Nematostella vectensis]
MRSIIPGRAVKSFAKAVHCLSKIGEELYLEALPDGIAIRTVNQSRSAYACFMFHSCFFLSYDDGRDELPDSSQVDDMVKCKIAMKSCLSAFKSVNTLEKSVDKCQIDLSIKEARLVFLFYCKHGITKTYNLTFQECESLQAVFTKDLCPNFISAQARLLNETVYNFPNNLDELTLSVNPELLKATNYAEDEPDPNKVIRTEMTLVPDEFDNYQIGAILSFAEFAGYPVNIHFETAGK